MKLIEEMLTGAYWSLLAIIIFFALRLLWKLAFSLLINVEDLRTKKWKQKKN